MAEDINNKSEIHQNQVDDNTNMEDEGENWTFVNSEDIKLMAKEKKCKKYEESADDCSQCSEHGSDSGSSIVVIDSPAVLLAASRLQLADNQQNDDEQSPIVTIDNEHTKISFAATPEEQPADKESFAASLEASDDTLSEKPCGEFIKEHSPYEELHTQECWVEEPATSENEEEISEESQVSNDSQKAISKKEVLEFSLISSAVIEPEINLEDGENLAVEENQVLVADSATSSAVGNNAAALLERKLEARDAEAEAEEAEWSSSEDDSDEDVWDLSLGIPNSNSMASSVSSLVQRPSISPVLVVEDLDVPTQQRVRKPDLLAEANRMEELDLMDYSSVTNPDLPPELNIANIFRERHYVHRPNQRLNLQLSYVVAFAMAAVVGFALGHIVGLSDNFPSRCKNLSTENMYSKLRHFQERSEGDWRAEVKRLNLENEELNRALKEQDAISVRFDLQVNELLTENYDLKQTIGRFRYGKPARSTEDRDTINRLQTENQDLRATVGKLRYSSGQPFTPNQQEHEEEKIPYLDEPVMEVLGTMNLTTGWNNLISDRNLSTAYQVNDLKETVADLLSLIGLRHDELVNLTLEHGSMATQKMFETLKRSAQKIIDLIERIRVHQESFAALATEVESRLQKIRLKLDTKWSQLMNSDNSVHLKNKEKSSLNADWFLAMGQQREKLRKNDRQSEWMFERAKNREQERRSRKFQAKNKKQKMFQGSSWNHYSA